MENRTVLLSHAALWAGYNGLTSAFLIAFALALGASNTLIGVLGALPWIASILSQIPGASLAQHHSRKYVTILFHLTNRLLWLPIILAPFLFEHPLFIVAGFFFLAELSSTITHPCYHSLLADVVSKQFRGDFVSLRHRIINLFGTIVLVLGGLWLKQFPKESPLGFALMFAFGIILGIASIIVFRKLDEPAYQDHEHHELKEFFTLRGQMKPFVAFNVLFNFAFMLASPFVTVYMLTTLEMSYAFFGIAAAIPTLSKVLFAHVIGKLTDQLGDKPFAIIGHFGTALVPLLFLFITPNTLWLVIPIQIYAGLAWSIVNISTYNLLLDLSDGKTRAMQIAEFNMYSSAPRIIAPIIGGLLIDHVAFILAGIPLIFVISSILRFASTFILFYIKEPRASREYPLIYVMEQALHFHPSHGPNTACTLSKNGSNFFIAEHARVSYGLSPSTCRPYPQSIVYQLAQRPR